MIGVKIVTVTNLNINFFFKLQLPGKSVTGNIITLFPSCSINSSKLLINSPDF